MARTQVRVTPDQAAQKWASRMQAAGQQITDGVNRVTTSPGQLAAAKFDKWLANVQAAGAKWRRNVGALQLADWQRSMIDIGIPRISAGVTAKQPKYQAFATQFFAYLQNGLQQLATMPDTTQEQRIQKAVFMMQYNAKFVRNPGGTP